MALINRVNKLSATVFMIMLLLLAAAVKTMAAIEPYQQKIQGKLKKGDTLLVKDEKFENPAYDWNNIRNNGVSNVITFGLQPEALANIHQPFSCKADLKVEYWSQPGQELPITLEHVKLDINYDTAIGAVYQIDARYEFQNAYKVKISINEINSDELKDLPEAFYLEAYVVVNRDYLPQPNASLIPTVTLDPGNDGSVSGGGMMSRAAIVPTANAVTVNWDVIPGAQKYDLEWTFIDEESANGTILNQSGTSTPAATLARMFRNNATRVTVSNNSYTISLVHNTKYLLIRMRTVDESNQYRNEGAWSYQIKSDNITVSGVIILSNTWHQPGLNWQYDATYAEEGKKKEVVAYFDGTLRNRQAVTLSNTDTTTIVQENIYDQFGRVVANILPAPADANILTYVPGFSRNNSGQAYTYNNVFKGLNGACIGLPDPLKTDTGASKYYSVKNKYLNTDPFNKYIPDAEGYPLSVTSYTPDNTGRVALKGGVGAAFQPVTTLQNHTTRYYYGKPEQWELDRLFGNDAGYADHYLKNMVIDPNGQISVSYQNAAGKTVATALTGSTPDTSLLALTSLTPAVKKDIILLQPERFVFDPATLKLTASTTYLASVPDSAAVFKFSMEKLIKKYVQGAVTICSNCYYELKVGVSDDCNNKILDISNVKAGSAISDCNQSASYDTTFNVSLKKIGEYYITFELALNQRVIEAFTTDFITRNTNLKTQFQFVMEQLKREDFTGCFSECTTCKDALGLKADFLLGMKTRMFKNGVDTLTNLAAINTWAGGLYDALYSNCQTIRAACLASPCDRLKSLMLMDVSPGGQYALFDSTYTAQESAINVIFQHWRDASVFPVQSPGGATYEATKFQLENGSYISPCDPSFTLAMLITYWKPEWSDKFLPFHPEFCALTFCGDHATYKTWDDRIARLYTTAADIPLIKTGLAYDVSNGAWLLDADPFFAAGGAGQNYYQNIKTELNSYSWQVVKAPIGLNTKSLSAYVDYLLYCADSTGSSNTGTNTSMTTRWNNCTPNATCRVPDRQWQMYANMYLELKEKYYQQLRDSFYCQGICVPGVAPKRYYGCESFSSSDFSVSGTTGIVYIYINASKPVVPGIALSVSYRVGATGPDVGCTFTSNTPQFFQVTVPSGKQIVNTTASVVCSGTPNYPPTCPVEYTNKETRVNRIDYKTQDPIDTSEVIGEGRYDLRSRINTACDVTITNLLTQLRPCFRSGTDSVLFRSRLMEVCTQGGDMNRMYGGSSTIGGKVNADGDSTFEQVIARYAAGPPYSLSCNPWLVDLPTPSGVTAQTTERTVSFTDAGICSKLNALKLEQQANQPTMTLYNYLVSKYGAGMNITSAELDVLVKGCNNCRYLLDRDVKLPVFLDGGAKGCISPTEFWVTRTAFRTALGNPTDTTSSDYKKAYRNYLNQKLGFSLSFSDYDNYRKSLLPGSTPMLCNQPVFSTIPTDPYDCMYMLVDGAIAGANRAYAIYIDSVKRDFRQQYVSVCSKAKTKVRLNTSQQIYHYTLYYYDQAGNLLRTVPPEGVTLIDDTDLLDQVDQARRADYSQCNYNGPQSNTNPDTTLSRLGTALTATGSQSLEMWLYNADGGPTQVLAASNGKAYFDVCIDGSYLHASIYKQGPITTGAADLVASNIVDANISSVLPLDQWVHVVLQGADLDSSGVISVFVNGVSCPVVTNAPLGGCGWDITANASGTATYAQNLAYLRQLRVYKRLMTTAEIAANAKENCLGLAPAYAVGLLKDTITWGRFNTPAPGSPTTLPDGGTTEVYTSAVYPRHRLSTDYAYNSLGQVLQQNSPDANTSYFWYDVKGRLLASRNANQYLGTNQYSYTEYDNLGRITEVGEKKNATSLGSPGFIIDATATQFLNSGTNGQITRTIYDVAQLDPATYPQSNLRKRVAASIYQETDGTTEQGTYYSYDALGNVKTLWQKLYGLYEMKKLDYAYDLVSGKVNAVRYQQAKPDQFFYNYKYDAENRIIKAQSGITHNGDNWTIMNPATTDAYYLYYKHGPLARTIIGKNGVQGIDYAYTLQGWLKTVNGTGLVPASDIGQDGVGSTATIAKDAAAYSLDYFTGDYKPIGGTGATALGTKYTATTTDITGQDLFNGNISRTTMALSKFNSGNPVGYSYRYDQLNRLVRMRQHLISGTTWGKAQAQTDYQEDISYDDNGNILTYLRNGTKDTSVAMDNLTYYYPRDAAGNLTANTLRHVKDAVSNTAYQSDLDNMPDDNYTYDKVGNLVKDNAAGITNITWTVYGKIKSITFSDNSSLSYKYDATGNRIYKEYTKGGVVNKTWYLRDVQGNTLAVYGNRNGDTETYWKEQHLYGSSRLGMWLPDMKVTGTPGNPSTLWSQANLTRYELSNHLGNVLATISDQQASQSATVYNMTDYAPFGMQMVGRKWSLSGAYRYGFNGKENDNEVKGEGNQQDYGMRIYDPRVGRFLSVDPLTKQYPHYTPYSYAGNKPIAFIDRDGEEEGIDNTLRRREEAYLSNQMSEDKYREHVRAMGINGVVGGVIVVDAFLTKGRVSEFLLFSQMAGAFNHNRAKTAEGRKEQETESRNTFLSAAMGWGAGKILGSTIRMGWEAAAEVKYLFRGTSEGFEGLSSLQRLGITPTSSDPVVATIFATNAENYGKGVLQVALPKNLRGVEFTSNVLSDMEKEIAVGIKPAEFTSKATLTITSGEARGILGEMGIKLPSKVKLDELSNVLRETPRLNDAQIDEFYKRASQLKKP